MTMDAMCTYLSERGFVAEKKYDKSTQSYRFTIGKDGWTLTKYFKYPAVGNPVVRDLIQKEFLEDMINKFNTDVTNANPIAHRRQQSMIIDDILKLDKEREMSTRRINWKVERTEVEFSPRVGERSQVTAVLTGYLDPLFVGDVFDIKDNLQRYLDKYMATDDRTMYVTQDVANTRELWTKTNPYIRQHIPAIKDVIFNNPATIVFWADGSKTVVKCQDDDVFDPEKGLAMAITKKALGNQGNYCNEIKKWTDKYRLEQLTVALDANNGDPFKLAAEKLKKLAAGLRSDIAEKNRVKCEAAYHVLYPTLHDPKASKKEMAGAMEEAVGYLEEILDK